jgi:ribosomal protein S18 acetylase RimI-like enzyme
MTASAVPLPTVLPEFPAADRPVDTPASLVARGLRLRHASNADLGWLCRLYATTRTEELANVPWPEQTKEAFLTDQFRLQHRHYVAHYHDSDFLILESDREPVGRYYLQRTGPDHLLVDISLLPHMRNRGIGRMLIEASQREAQRHGCGMTLHVLQHNAAARRLYERMGFVVIQTQGTHHLMHWSTSGQSEAY